MAFERLSINKNPNGGKLAFNGSAKSKTKGSNKPVPPRLTNGLPPAFLPPTSPAVSPGYFTVSQQPHPMQMPVSGPRPGVPSIQMPVVSAGRPPVTNVLPPFGGAPQTGGELPPFTGTTTPPASSNSRTPFKDAKAAAAAKGGRRVTSTDNFQRAFQAWADNRFKNGGNSIFAGFGDRGLGGSGAGPGNGGKPTNTKPPATPTPQWAFKPNSFDQPNYAQAPGPASQYMTNPPAQPWMFDPATYGQGAPPQWYTQPIAPNSQPPYRY